MTAKKPHSLFQLTATITRAQFVGISVAVFATLLAAWWITSITGWVTPLFLPGPAQVMDQLWALAKPVIERSGARRS